MLDDIYSGPMLKIKRAYCHIHELESRVQDYIKTDFYSISINEDPKTGNQSLKFAVPEPVPEYFSLCIGDAIHNLRSALDILICSIVRCAGGDITKCEFPFSYDKEKLIKIMEKGEINKVRPDLIPFILDTIKPYKIGNLDIWNLNLLDNIDKHRLIIPVISVTQLSGISAKDDNDNILTDLTASINNIGTINIINTTAKLHIISYGQRDITLIFDKGLPFESEPVIPKLHILADKTTSIIDSFRIITS